MQRTGVRLALAVAVLAALVACGDDGSTKPVAHTTTAQAQVTDKPPIPLPTAADLNAGLLLVFDPASSPALKTGVIQGAEADPSLVDRLVQAATTSKVTMTIVGVQYQGNGLMNASANLTVNGQPVQGQTVIPFVVDGGRWRVQKAWTCQMLANASVSSPACP